MAQRACIFFVLFRKFFRVESHEKNTGPEAIGRHFLKTLSQICSPLFTALRDQNVLMEEHNGGCVLFERRETVEALFTESVSK